MELKWTRRALLNLDQIAAYIAKDNPTRAASFMQEIKRKVGNLKSFQIGSPGRVAGTTEYVLHKNYIAIYRVKNNQIHILRIHHAAMDL